MFVGRGLGRWLLLRAMRLGSWLEFIRLCLLRWLGGGCPMPFISGRTFLHIGRPRGR